MKAQNRIRTATLLLAAMFASTAAAQDFRTARVARQVLVSVPDRKLAVLEGGKVIRTFPVAVGATVSPSPSGEFKVVNRIANPTYYHPGVGNPIGTRWLGLNRKGYGIHAPTSRDPSARPPRTDAFACAIATWNSSFAWSA